MMHWLEQAEAGADVRDSLPLPPPGTAQATRVSPPTPATYSDAGGTQTRRRDRHTSVVAAHAPRPGRA